MPFITFEGIDQSGKSTQIELLARALEAAGMETVSVREPGGTPLGNSIREMLLGFEFVGMDSWAEALLYAAARAQLVKDVIRPSLQSDKIVISDRYIDSSIVYQGMARGLGAQRILELNLDVTGGLMPDLTFVFHLDVDISRERMVNRGTAGDRIEGEPDDFQKRVEEGYLRLEEMFPDRIAGIDAGDSVQDIHAAIIRECRLRLGINL